MLDYGGNEIMGNKFFDRLKIKTKPH